MDLKALPETSQPKRQVLLKAFILKHRDIIYFKNGFYGYTLMTKFIFPACESSVSFIDEALEFMLGFKVIFLAT